MSTWKPVPGYPQYQMSDKGVVEYISPYGKTREVMPARASNGQQYIQLYQNNMRKTYMLHKLYATVFEISEADAKRIVYHSYTGDPEAKQRVIQWLEDRIREVTEEAVKEYRVPGDEYMYLSSFLEMMLKEK